MKWSIFDAKNQATLDEVRDRFGITTKRLDELKAALERTKNHIDQVQGQSEKRHQAISAFKKAVESANFRSRRDVLTVFNQGILKTKVKDLMQQGLNVAYVDAVSSKAGVKKVYKFETDKSGRVRLDVATPDNPHEVASSGLYTVTIIGSEREKAYAKIIKTRSHSSKAVAPTRIRKSRKPRISFDDAIKA